MVIGQDNLPWSILTVVRARFIKIIWQKRWNIIYIGTGWCWYDILWQCDTAQAQTEPHHSIKCLIVCSASASVVLMMMICAGEMWQQCGRFVHIRYTRHASPLLLYTRWSPLQSNIEIKMLQAGRFPSPTHCWYPRTVSQWQAHTLRTVRRDVWLKSIFYCFPVISRKLMFTTGCALTSHWSNYKEAEPALPHQILHKTLRHNITTRHNYH